MSVTKPAKRTDLNAVFITPSMLVASIPCWCHPEHPASLLSDVSQFLSVCVPSDFHGGERPRIIRSVSRTNDCDKPWYRKTANGFSRTRTEDRPVMSRMLWPTELMALKNGRGGRIWTRDPLVPNQLRYQTALHPEAFIFRVSNNILTPFCFPVKIIFSTILFLTFALLKKKSSSFSRSLSIIG